MWIMWITRCITHICRKIKVFQWGNSRENCAQKMWTMWISQKSNIVFVQLDQLTIIPQVMVTGLVVVHSLAIDWNVNFL